MSSNAGEPWRRSSHTTIAPPEPSASTSGRIRAAEPEHTRTPPAVHCATPSALTRCARTAMLVALVLSCHTTMPPPAPSGANEGALGTPGEAITGAPSGIQPRLADAVSVAKATEIAWPVATLENV